MLFSPALPAVALEYACLQYGPIDIAGTIVRHTYAGPPDYESVTKGDEPRTVWVLQLDERICVDANTRYPREVIQLEIELALTPEQFQRYRDLLGQRVRVSGELKHGGANYQKRLVIDPNDIEKTRLLP
ncbi:hypothetical protein GCM10011487_31230 [Steroidobacter agaridevorans]|uniref:DUF4431 domain-containing protein n=1 Tax=Steroidobacter agaridevorans TaxID=2695856 RepID=A0A829YDV2_9GAMM|nr:DUF4431 domain-containing protein [Steroidobacter agaridevorans]GFE81123.1 hypothetical protein GCM10011487_31230 [Steroidobacter agaridevorans]GFE88992.1 hypothetical protein GCM10011488_39460 [Steroidobacter agaridevorans]